MEVQQVATYCAALNSLIDIHSALIDPTSLASYPKEQHDTFIKYHTDCIANLMPQLRDQVRVLTKLILADHQRCESPAVTIMRITSPKIAVIDCNDMRDCDESRDHNSLSNEGNDWETTDNGSNI